MTEYILAVLNVYCRFSCHIQQNHQFNTISNDITFTWARSIASIQLCRREQSNLFWPMKASVFLVTCHQYSIMWMFYVFIFAVQNSAANISLHIWSELSVCDIFEWTHLRSDYWTWKEKLIIFHPTFFAGIVNRRIKNEFVGGWQFLFVHIAGYMFSLYFLSIFVPISTADINWFYQNRTNTVILLLLSLFKINGDWIEWSYCMTEQSSFKRKKNSLFFSLRMLLPT